MNQIIIFIIFICFIYFIFFDFNTWFTIEHFDVSEKIKFKKTMTYDLVYYNNNKNYSVWTPRIIDDYYPLGHIVTKGKSKPNVLSVLVKSQSSQPKDIPESYLPVSLIIENGKQTGAFWKPVENKGYSSLGHIYHRALRRGVSPSIHKHIRCINNKYLLANTVNDKIISENTTPGYQIWSIQDSDLFITNENIISKEPKQKVYKLNPKYLDSPKKIKTKKTQSYKLIYTKFNRFTNKHVSFWRPLPLDQYVSIGDIVIDKSPKMYDPNNKLETLVIHKNFVKLPIEFGTEPIAIVKNNNTVEASFWKPVPPDGYGCSGHIVNIGSGEPRQNNIIYCIPLEYLVKSNNKKNNLWNTIQIPKNRMSVWSNDKNYFLTNNKYGYHNDIDLELDDNLIDYEKDLLDKKTIIGLFYKLNPKNTEIYSSDTRDRLFRQTLSNRLGIKEYRIGYLKFYGRKVMAELMPKPAGSQEPLISDIINNLKLLIKNNLKVINSKKDGYISTITSMSIESEVDDTKTKIDNSQFSKKIKKIF